MRCQWRSWSSSAALAIPSIRRWFQWTAWRGSFLITDSEENFGQMRRTLGRKFECVQLYKSYLENFRINTQDALNG